MIISPKWDYCMKELFRNEVIRKYFISVVLNIPVEGETVQQPGGAACDRTEQSPDGTDDR